MKPGLISFLKCLLLSGGLLSSVVAGAQDSIVPPGLERIWVEKYYISTAADTIASDSGGYLPVGSVTYRVWADLLPVYRFQSVFGIEGHPLKIATSTRFYNNKYHDGRFATELDPYFYPHGAVMLDSYVSTGAACLDYRAVPKEEEKDTSKTLVWSNRMGILRNNDPAIGCPLTERDGMYALSLQPTTNSYNLEGLYRLLSYAARDSVENGVFVTEDALWYSLGGTNGVQPDNRVLIGQFTTDGVFSFEMNVQVAIPFQKASQFFVAVNPDEKQLSIPSLKFNSSPDNSAPSISLSAASPDKLKKGSKIVLSPVLSDNDGKVVKVEYWVNDKPVITKTADDSTHTLRYPGFPVKISARAFDDRGAVTMSNEVRIGELIP